MKDVIIKNTVTAYLCTFHVSGVNKQTGESTFMTVTVSKGQLQAAQIVGQSSKELIERMCERQGFYVLEIGKPKKQTVMLDLNELSKEAVR